MSLTSAQREALDELADGDWHIVHGRRTGNSFINQIAAESLIALGLARWQREGYAIEITPKGREQLA